MTSEILQLQRELNQIIRNESILIKIQRLAKEATAMADLLMIKTAGVAVSRRETQILSLISRISSQIGEKPSNQRLSQLFKRLVCLEPYAVAMVQSKVDRPSLQ